MMYLLWKGKYDNLTEYHLKSLSCLSRTSNPHSLSSCEMYLLFSSSFSALFWHLFFSDVPIPPWNSALSLAADCENEHTSVTVFQIAKILCKFKTSYQGSTGGNKKAVQKSRVTLPQGPESIHFHQGIWVTIWCSDKTWPDPATPGIPQYESHAWVLFYSYAKKKLAWPAVQHCSCMPLWSISPCQVMNSLNWHLNCIQEQLLLTLVQTGFWRVICWTVLHWPPIKVKPILFSTTFDRKCPQEPKRILQGWEKENWHAALPSYCYLQLLYLSLSILFVS